MKVHAAAMINIQAALKEFRCQCGKLLFRGEPLRTKVEIKCKRCGILKIFDKDEE